MNPFMKSLQILTLFIAVIYITGCTRTVQWEEEVPLNTGETIVVKRSGTYSYRSEAGNPLNYAHRPDRRSTIEFTYRGKPYMHSGDASLMALAIAPSGIPNLVASAADTGWQWNHDYLCAMPSYVQFRPNPSGLEWSWPDQIEPWLYRTPTNLMFGLPELKDDGKKFTSENRAIENAPLLSAGKHFREVDPTFQHQTCKRKN